MTDFTEVAIVTAAAIAALGVLVWPIVPRKKSHVPAKPGCANCEQSPTRGDLR